MRPLFPLSVRPRGLFALSLITAALYSSTAAATVVVENGSSFTVDSSLLADRYVVREQSTLNTLAGSSLREVSVFEGSVLNMQGSEVNAQDYGLIINNSTATVVDSIIRSQYVGSTPVASWVQQLAVRRSRSATVMSPA